MKVTLDLSSAFNQYVTLTFHADPFLHTFLGMDEFDRYDEGSIESFSGWELSIILIKVVLDEFAQHCECK